MSTLAHDAEINFLAFRLREFDKRLEDTQREREQIADRLARLDVGETNT